MAAYVRQSTLGGGSKEPSTRSNAPYAKHTWTSAVADALSPSAGSVDSGTVSVAAVIL